MVAVGVAVAVVVAVVVGVAVVVAVGVAVGVVVAVGVGVAVAVAVVVVVAVAVVVVTQTQKESCMRMSLSDVSKKFEESRDLISSSLPRHMSADRMIEQALNARRVPGLFHRMAERSGSGLQIPQRGSESHSGVWAPDHPRSANPG